MVNLAAQLIALLVAVYTTNYAMQVWRRERNPLGAVAVAVLALATVALPFYILYLRG